jgi:molybdate transport system ATP-binding protein
MALEVRVAKTLPGFELEVSFTCGEGDLVVLTGPSGSGKTTLVRMIAGLVRPDRGTVRYNGDTWVDTEKGVFVPARKRGVGYVFQEYSLFPHLTVYRNVAFAAPDRHEVERLLRLFGIWHLRDSMPHRISGGERQRCAICQNLARAPRVLLLDEPFSALDVEMRRTLRRELKALKEDLSIPMVHVTHDLTEALFLGDHILPIVEGKPDPSWLRRQVDLAREEEARSGTRSAPWQGKRPDSPFQASARFRAEQS